MQEPTAVRILHEQLQTLIDLGYGDMPVYFDTEAQHYHVHLVPVGPISWDAADSEIFGKDMLILNEATPRVHRG